MTSRKQLDQNFKSILQSIESYKKKYKNSAEKIQLIAVSKTYPIEKILELYKLNQCDFAENYLNEALVKIEQIKNLNKEKKRNSLSNPDNLAQKKLIHINWHYIGQIQSNKTKEIAINFDWVHSVDRLNIAKRLNTSRPKHLKKLNILIQVNIEQDEDKSGVNPKSLLELSTQIQQLDKLKLRGFMCILKRDSSLSTNLDISSFDIQYTAFNKLRELLIDLNNNHNFALDTLSMGMSNDFKAAIAAGSNMLRIGSAIFGPRIL